MTAIAARLLMFVLSFSAPLVSQTPSTVSGTVTADGRGRSGVTVAAYPPGETRAVVSATTDADGRYRLSLSRGVYRLEFSAPGFETARRTGFVVLPDSEAQLDIALIPAGQTLEETIGDLRPGEVAVKIETTFGIILLAIDTKHAPVTAANFLKYVDARLYNGGRFHRTTRPDNYTPAPPNRPMMELIQGGINPDRRTEGFPPIPLERTTVTGLKHVAGTVSMARGTAADTATSDFFILLNDQPSLDAGGKRFDDEQGAAAFGRVIFGLGVVRKIQRQPAQGQNLTPPILILSISRQ